MTGWIPSPYRRRRAGGDPMKRILFLDIDGVLNCATTAERFKGLTGIESRRVRYLQRIVEATNADIILSSTWRLQPHSHAEVCRVLGQWDLRVEDCTPDWREAAETLGWPLRMSAPYLRACEILAWLHVNHMDSYAILDDDTLIGTYDHQQDPEGCNEIARRHVRTTWAQGMGARHVQPVIDLLMTEVTP